MAAHRRRTDFLDWDGTLFDDRVGFVARDWSDSQRAAPFAQGAPMGMPTSMPQAMPMPQTRQMPRADAEPVGYFTYPTYPAYPQYVWYYGNGYGY